MNSELGTRNSEKSKASAFRLGLGRSAFRAPRSEFSFTLIELLAVIAIIMVLAGMLYPALRSIRDAPKKARARADIKKIESGIQSFYNEYGKWPPTPASAEEFYSMMNGNVKPYNGAVLATAYTNNNPRRVRFLELDKAQVNSANELLDPWGKPYWICLDNGGGGFGTAFVGNNWGDQSSWDTSSPMPANDGMIRYRANTTYGFKKQIAIYSFGPNKSEDNAAGPEYDDITSWY